MENKNLLLARILEHIPDGVIVISVAGTITYINAASKRRLGFEKNELLDSAVEDIIMDASNEGGWEFIRKQILEGPGVYNGVNNFACKDKSVIVCDTNGFCIHNDKNEPEDLVLVFRDISKEKKVAEELEKNNLEMAKINAELIRSNQEQKRVSEVKTKFLSIASHELKTPLTSIKGYSEIIIDNMKETIDPAVLGMIERIDRAADRLHDVINNMLDVTRIEQKRLRLKPENISMKQAVDESLEEFSQFAKRRQIVFNCRFQENLPLFYGDKIRMHQVFNNLFSNALKFSPDNSEIEVHIFIDEEERFNITVRDHGIGIDKEELEKVFDPFYEVGHPTKHSTDAVKFMGGGTGLGLSIVRGVVERHGGVIWAESEGTKKDAFPGSTFYVLLPIKSRIQWDDDETQIIKMNRILQTPPLKEGEERYRSSDKKEVVLIIDNDPEAIEITRMVLQDSFEIITAETGESGLRMAFCEHPSVILLDLYLPGLNGCQICRILRSQEETKYIPVSFFTVATQNEEMEQCYASGADDFIVKPFNGKEMVDKIARLIALKYANEKNKNAQTDQER